MHEYLPPRFRKYWQTSTVQCSRQMEPEMVINRLASTASACRSLIFIAAPSRCGIALTLNRCCSSRARLRQSFVRLCPAVERLYLTFVREAPRPASERHHAYG